MRSLTLLIVVALAIFLVSELADASTGPPRPTHAAPTGAGPAPVTGATPDEAEKKCAGLSSFKKFACKMRHGLKKLFGREVADQLIREWQE